MSQSFANLAKRFQSTHPQGVRHLLCVYYNFTICVSIHAPAGGATFVWVIFASNLVVSIHAPAGGATTMQMRRYSEIRGFNPRTRRGCDTRAARSLHPLLYQFQSTHPQGVRL